MEHREAHKARAAARYAAKREEVKAMNAVYRGTAAGMLTEARSAAKRRSIQ